MQRLFLLFTIATCIFSVSRGAQAFDPKNETHQEIRKAVLHYISEYGSDQKELNVESPSSNIIDIMTPTPGPTGLAEVLVWNPADTSGLTLKLDVEYNPFGAHVEADMGSGGWQKLDIWINHGLNKLGYPADKKYTPEVQMNMAREEELARRQSSNHFRLDGSAYVNCNAALKPPR